MAPSVAPSTTRPATTHNMSRLPALLAQIPGPLAAEITQAIADDMAFALDLGTRIATNKAGAR